MNKISRRDTTNKTRLMWNKLKFGAGLIIILFCVASLRVNAQFSFSGELRLRNEFRGGYGSPLPEGTNPAFFISQRTRLNVDYIKYRLKFRVSIQDVRVWGQDVSTINQSTTQNNNGFMLYEAWAEIQLTDTTLKNKALLLKIGRQELIYDDQRLLGNSDWVLQGRRFDAGVLKFETTSWSIHLAAAYNQNQANNSGTVYNPIPPGNYPASTNGDAMYKSLEFLHAEKHLHPGSLSFLFLTDQFSRYKNDTINNTPTKTYLSSTWARATTGFYFNERFHNIAVNASAYYQFGKSSSGQQLSTSLFSGYVQYFFENKYNAAAGIDYTSGGTHVSTSNLFDPLYGTPHKFWGLMDYYYVSSPFGNGGLVDYYLKTKANLTEVSWLTTDFHEFSSAQQINRSKNFGQEIDMVYSYNLTKEINLEAGYCHFWSTALLSSQVVKNVLNANSNSNWAYIQVDICPDFIFKK
jgi:Alginate export